MSILVVYESMWGNTRAVADAIARGLGPDTAVVEVTRAPADIPADVDLLVVGGPTHAFSMSRGTTRHDAAQRGAPGVRKHRASASGWPASSQRASTPTTCPARDPGGRTSSGSPPSTPGSPR